MTKDEMMIEVMIETNFDEDKIGRFASYLEDPTNTLDDCYLMMMLILWE